VVPPALAAARAAAGYAAYGGGRIMAPSPPSVSAPAAAGLPGNLTGLVGRTVADVERDLIIDTLYHCLGNRTHAATILGISIRTLRNKLKQYSEEGIAVPPPGDVERVAL
jgi:two-component system response regulator FlrC